MIKFIAFDLVGVLVSEKDIDLTPEEDKLERLFGPNKNDSDYLFEGRKIISKDAVLIAMTEKIIEKLYKVKDSNLFSKLIVKYPNLKFIIATNHVSYIRNYIGENLDIDYISDIIISAEINKIKPNLDFYLEVIDRTNVLAEEILFVDDNQKNIDGALTLGMKGLKINSEDDVYDKIISYLNDLNL